MYMRGSPWLNLAIAGERLIIASQRMAEKLLKFARNVLEVESDAVRAAAAGIDEHFAEAVQLILACPASVLVSGIGKAGHIARKISATLASTGTPSHFLSASDAVHGDLGSVRQGDLILVFSASGESDEILRMASIVRKLSHRLIAITATRTNSLAKFADVTIAMGKIEEACPLKLAPSATTTAMLALGDALALTVMDQRKFTAEQFAVFHPAGQIGRKLIKVSEAMTFRTGENLPVASDALTVGQVLHAVSAIKRRSGAVILVNKQEKISGIFTDGDLRRLIQENDAKGLDRPIKEVMHADPKRIAADALASEAMAIMQRHRIDELPVVDEKDHPVGLIDVQDLVVLRMLDIDEK
jgi:arabinose-5-phosphate isomerase